MRSITTVKLSARSLAIIVAVLTLLAFAIAGSGYFIVWHKLQDVKAREKSKAYQSLHHFYLKQLQQAETDTILIIGDSHVQSLLAQRIHSRAINLGIGGDTIQGVTNRLQDYHNIAPDSMAVVLVGTNNLLTESIADSIGRLPRLARLLEAFPGVFWVGAPHASSARISAAKIAQFNESVEKTCVSMSHCRYINGFPTDMNTSAYLNIDGIHLTPAGYEHLTSQIRQDIIASSRATPFQGDASAPQNL